MSSDNSYVRWFSTITMQDLPLVGGKNASLGEMYSQLNQHDILVPNGFALTTRAYAQLIKENDLETKLAEILSDLVPENPDDLLRRAEQCQNMLYQATLPESVHTELMAAFEQLTQEYGQELTVAVRSSATAEDLPHASFAGQHESFLNVDGASLKDACMRCYASLYTPRAIRYRIQNQIDHSQVALSIGVMKMVRSDLAASGVTFTLDTDSGHRGVVYTTATCGLGESLVKGNIDPDEFYVHKDRLNAGYRAVMKRHLGAKQSKLIFAGNQVEEKVCSDTERQTFSITDDEAIQLADIALRIESHYSQLAGSSQPMDIEWAKDGLDERLYIVQARPETIASKRAQNRFERYALKTKAQPLLKGKAVGHQIATGNVRLIKDDNDLLHFTPGEILVAETTSPDWGAVMKEAAGIVTDRGGRTCHAAIVARELGIPAVVGTDVATQQLKTGDVITVACGKGETGEIYQGEQAFEKTVTQLNEIQRPKTKIMVNLGNPDLALKTSQMPNDGVGLARMEFIINNHVQLHPMAACHPERLDKSVQQQIKNLTARYPSPVEYFVSTLAEGIGSIAGAFYPKPVIIRLSDFKTNEYAQLLGGAVFEPEESNPMIGFRGAARYTHPMYAEGFALECKAIEWVRSVMGFTNLSVMIPFCRRVEEGQRTIAAMAEQGLKRDDSLKIYLMCEIPNNVVQVDAFAQDFDGFSIGSNDLTQLTLGVDRDSEIVAFDFDERDPGVLAMLEMAVKGAQRNQRYCGICGQAPSDYPEIAEFLVKLGIDSMSLTPDALIPVSVRVAELENELHAH